MPWTATEGSTRRFTDRHSGSNNVDIKCAKDQRKANGQGSKPEFHATRILWLGGSFGNFEGLQACGLLCCWSVHFCLILSASSRIELRLCRMGRRHVGGQRGCDLLRASSSLGNSDMKNMRRSSKAVTYIYPPRRLQETRWSD